MKLLILTVDDCQTKNLKRWASGRGSSISNRIIFKRGDSIAMNTCQSPCNSSTIGSREVTIKWRQSNSIETLKLDWIVTTITLSSHCFWLWVALLQQATGPKHHHPRCFSRELSKNTWKTLTYIPWKASLVYQITLFLMFLTAERISKKMEFYCVWKKERNWREKS